MTHHRLHGTRTGLNRTAGAFRSALVMLVAQLAVSTAGADNRPFRCGSKIIYVGMTRADVFEYCGAPTSESTELRDVRSNNNRILGATKINRWIYESYNTRVLVFLDDELQSIERL